MIELPTEQAEMLRFGLADKSRIVRGINGGDADTDGTIDLSRPMVTPIDAELAKGDPELLAFWKAERKTYRYDYVTFRCSLDPDPAEPFEKVWIKLTLAAEGLEQAIAWSMSPKEIAEVTEVSQSATLGAKVQLFSAEIGGSRKMTQTNYFLQARGEHSASPSWRFAATPGSRVQGMFALHLVVRSPRDVAVACRLSAEAVVAKRAFWIFSASEPMATGAGVDFQLPSRG